MPKTAPWFRLDWSFKGSSINYHHKRCHQGPKAEPIKVSRQRLSLCSDGIKDSSPWFGHGQKLRRQRKIHKRRVNGEQQTDGAQTGLENPEAEVVTRRGRQVRIPARYRAVTVLKSRQQ